jgi:hypothetical protein
LIVPAIGRGGGRKEDFIAVKGGQCAKNKIDEEKEDEKPSPRYLCDLLKVRHYGKTQLLLPASLWNRKKQN